MGREGEEGGGGVSKGRERERLEERMVRELVTQTHALHVECEYATSIPQAPSVDLLCGRVTIFLRGIGLK